jgi:hypothetical protein
MDMERVMELLLVIEEKMDSHYEKTDINLKEIRASQDGFLASRNENMAKRDYGLPRSDEGLSGE